MIEAVSYDETSVSIYQTLHCEVPKDSSLYTVCRSNLKIRIHNAVMDIRLHLQVHMHTLLYTVSPPPQGHLLP
jgi:hypothetical protein